MEKVCTKLNRWECFMCCQENKQVSVNISSMLTPHWWSMHLYISIHLLPCMSNPALLHMLLWDQACLHFSFCKIYSNTHISSFCCGQMDINLWCCGFSKSLCTCAYRKIVKLIALLTFIKLIHLLIQCFFFFCLITHK